MLLTLQTGHQVRKDFGRKLLDDYPMRKNPTPTGSQNSTSPCQTSPRFWPASITGTHTLILNSAHVCKIIFPETETIMNSTHNLREREWEKVRDKKCKYTSDSSSLRNEPDSHLVDSLIFPFICTEF